MNYFRAVLKADERTERSLEIVSKAIDLNAANYTAWYFRRLILEALSYDYDKELLFLNELGEEHPKNYQIWY